MRRLLPWGLGICVAVSACSSSGGDAPATPAVVHVDEDDVFCDPVDAVADDALTPATPSAEPLTQWVDPRIGTGGIGFAVGTTYPGPQTPFGMAKPGPDYGTNESNAGWEATGDLHGFSQLHVSGTGGGPSELSAKVTAMNAADAAGSATNQRQRVATRL